MPVVLPASEADYRDFLGRIVGWYDEHLKKDVKKTADADR